MKNPSPQIRILVSSNILKKSENGAVVFLSRKIADLDINKLMPISSALFSKIDGNIFW